MDLKDKLAILADAAKYDASCASSGVKRKAEKNGIGNVQGSGICHSYTPDGRCISLLKILLTNFCIYDCSYCINRVSSQVKRAKFTVDEVVTLTMDFYKRNYIEGLFLSSGIAKDSDETMEEMILIAKKLRVEHRFGGYIHLKAVAGCSEALLKKAGLYADRLSANIELPLQKDLDDLAPAKTHSEIEDSMSKIRDTILENKEDQNKFKKAPVYAPGGQSTQMIVGATQSSDRDIMLKASELYKKQNLKRVYYSAFSPIPDGDPNLPLIKPPMMREHRLYQSDWLIRLYGFDVNEVVPENEKELSLDIDPKLAWALRNKHLFPVDLNTAPKEMLLRVPGLGMRNVERILQARNVRKIRSDDLLKMRLNFQKMKFFVTTHDDFQGARLLDSPFLKTLLTEKENVQLDLFDAQTGSLTDSDKEAIAQELQREAQSGKHDTKTQEFLKKVSEVFQNTKSNLEVEVNKLKTDCADCNREMKAKTFMEKLGRAVGKGAAWLSTKTAKPFMASSAFVKGVVEKGDKNKDMVALYQFFLNHQDEFDKLYLEAGTPDEMIELMLVKMEEIMKKKNNIIMRDFLVHLGVKREIPEDLSNFELSAEEIAAIDQSKIDPDYINLHPEYKEVRALVGDVTKNELMDIITSGYLNKSISFENYKEAMPSIPELVGTVAGQLFVPKIALGVISSTLSGLYMTPVVAADIGTAISTTICLEKDTQAKFAQDKDLKMFCSYVTNKSGYDLLKSRAKGYIAGKKFHEKAAEKIKAYKEKRALKKQLHE